MVKNMFKNKKISALIIVLILIVSSVSVFSVGCGKKDSKEDDKTGTKIEIEEGDDETHVINEEGLSVEDGTADTIDGSGDWDAKDEDDKSDKDKSQNKNEDKQDDKKDETQDQDKTDKKEDAQDKDSGNMSEQILESDGTKWGKIN